MKWLRLAWLPVLLWACGAAPTVGDPGAESAVAAVLDDFHAAASVADGPRYFGHFTDDGVFIGTDATERWSVDEFKAYAAPHFSKGKGWTYVARERHVAFSPDGAVAWFDEALHNESYGAVRGSGVLRSVDGRWRIAQYVLSFAVPNDRAETVIRVIREASPVPRGTP